MRRSLRASVEGDAARAQTWLERAVALDSSDVDAYQALARLYRARGEVGRSIRMHQNLLLRGDLDREAQLLAKIELARDFEAGGFRERAIATLDELEGASPRDPEGIEAMALAWIESGDRVRATSLISRLRRLDPERARRIEAGPLASSSAATAEPPRVGGRLSRWVTRFGARRRADADESALWARLERDAGDHAARIALARIEIDRGREERARELLAHGLALAPEAWGLHVEHGRLALATGRAEPALEAYSRLLAALEAALARGASVPAPERGRVAGLDRIGEGRA
ncbi:MAG: hypothetical protein U0900_02570 [Myxococcota bacterium]